MSSKQESAGYWTSEEDIVSFLRLAILAIFAGSAVFLVVLLVSAPEQPIRTLGPTILSLVAALTYYLLSRRRLRIAMFVLGFGIWAQATAMAIITGGVRAPAIYLYPLIILMAGWLLGSRIAYLFTGMSVLAGIGLVFFESRNLLPAPTTPPTVLWIVQACTFAFMAIMVTMLVRSYQARLREVSALTADLSRQVGALAASEASYHGLFNSVQEAIYVQDREGRFLDVNDGAVRMYGHPREAFIGRTPQFVSAPGKNDLGKVGAMVAQAFAGEPQRFEFWGLRANGEIFPKDVRLVRGTWFGQEVVIATADDITARKRAEEELRRSEEKFLKVFHSSPIAICITRLSDGCYLEMNDAFVRLFGWTREEALGRTSVELGKWIRPEERQAWAAELRRHGRAAGYEMHLHNKAGDVLLIRFSAEVIDLRGEACVLVLAEDQTARKRSEIALRESQAQLAEAQRIGHLGSWEFDHATDTFIWSDEITRIFETQMPSGTVDYATFLKTVHADDRDTFDKAFRQSLAAGTPGEFTFRLRMPDGRIKVAHARCETRLGADGRPLKSIGTTQDITEQEQARQEVRRLNAELEQRVVERTAELTSANRELESFAYSISHDLRAPLRGIDGFSLLLAEEYAERLDEQGRDYLDRVRRAAQRMGGLIDDILELSRVTRQDMRRAKVDLSQVAAELVEERARAEPGHRVAVALMPSCTAVGDPQLLRVMMQNLIENAWKYSARAASPNIEFGSEAAEGETVFFVRDNGVGFDMKYAGRLFSPFQRLHKPEEFEGAGIGLATVARVVHRHGGRVWAEAEPGKGATFRFTLPG